MIWNDIGPNLEKAIDNLDMVVYGYPKTKWEAEERHKKRKEEEKRKQEEWEAQIEACFRTIEAAADKSWALLCKLVRGIARRFCIRD